MRRFWSDNKGGVAILFALAIIPIFGAVGAALDYSMASAYRTDLQKSLDATALALSKIMPANQNTLDTVGKQYFDANLGFDSAQGKANLSNIQLTITPGTGTLALKVTATYTPELANIMGVTSFQIGTNTLAKWSIGKVEVALALDNTGSMASSGKLTQLKTAANILIDTFQQAVANPGDAKISIVPFGEQVKADPVTYVNAAWVRWDLWENTNGTCSSSWYTTKSSCISHGKIWTPSSHSNWNGCIMDRDKDNDVSDVAPTTTATNFPAAQECGSLATIMPLSYDWTALKNKINQMQAVGYTNIPIGLAWGWNTISPTSSNLPLSLGSAYGTADLTKYVILLTDGDNTDNRWGDSDWTIDQRTSLLCVAIKAKNIKIYTIRVINGNATLLKNCATDASMYYDVQDASQLSGVFSAIGSQIANLHLAK